MNALSPQTLDHGQFSASAAATRERFALIQKKYPSLKGYLVLAVPGEQAGIDRSAKEILGDLEYALIAHLQADDLVDRELTPQTRASIRIVLGSLAAFFRENR